MTLKPGFYLIALLCCAVLSGVVLAQEETSPVMTARNVTSIAPVAQIDFAGTSVQTGWFFMNRAGTRFVTHSAHEIYVWTVTSQGTVSDPTILETKPAVLTSAAFAPDDTLYGVIQDVDPVIVNIDEGLTPIHTLKGWSLMNLWADEEALWSEAFSTDVTAQQAVLRIPYQPDEEIEVLPYAPGADLDAVVRIGRIPTPYTVTSTETGDLTVWNLETGERLFQASTGVEGAAVFGAINTPVTHLTWRDSESKTLYWLDLKTQRNVPVADLNGDYIQWLFLTPAADVIFGVDKQFSQHLTAWIVGGKTLDLGPYRSCGRPQPDMSLLSEDGTTLAIGCDTGLEIWRVKQD